MVQPVAFRQTMDRVEQKPRRRRANHHARVENSHRPGPGIHRHLCARPLGRRPEDLQLARCAAAWLLGLARLSCTNAGGRRPLGQQALGSGRNPRRRLAPEDASHIIDPRQVAACPNGSTSSVILVAVENTAQNKTRWRLVWNIFWRCTSTKLAGPKCRRASRNKAWPPMPLTLRL